MIDRNLPYRFLRGQPLNRYSFLEALEDKLLPNTKIEFNIEIEKDANLIFKLLIIVELL